MRSSNAFTRKGSSCMSMSLDIAAQSASSMSMSMEGSKSNISRNQNVDTRMSFESNALKNGKLKMQDQLHFPKHLNLKERGSLAETLLYHKGFRFRTRQGKKIDFREISKIDINKVNDEVDIGTLQSLLENIVLSDVTEDDLNLYNGNCFVRLFRLSQMIVEYLLNVQHVLSSELNAVANKYAEGKREEERLKPSSIDQDECVTALQEEINSKSRASFMSLQDHTDQRRNVPEEKINNFSNRLKTDEKLVRNSKGNEQKLQNTMGLIMQEIQKREERELEIKAEFEMRFKSIQQLMRNEIRSEISSVLQDKFSSERGTKDVAPAHCVGNLKGDNGSDRNKILQKEQYSKKGEMKKIEESATLKLVADKCISSSQDESLTNFSKMKKREGKENSEDASKKQKSGVQFDEAQNYLDFVADNDQISVLTQSDFSLQTGFFHDNDNGSQNRSALSKQQLSKRSASLLACSNEEKNIHNTSVNDKKDETIIDISAKNSLEKTDSPRVISTDPGEKQVVNEENSNSFDFNLDISSDTSDSSDDENKTPIICCNENSLSDDFHTVDTNSMKLRTSFVHKKGSKGKTKKKKDEDKKKLRTVIPSFRKRSGTLRKLVDTFHVIGKRNSHR